MIDETAPLGRRTRVRGATAVWIRQTITQPLARRVPVDALRCIHRRRRRLLPHRYTDADPFRIVEVDPTRLERSILEWAPKHPQWGRVEGGAWDRQWEPFDGRAVPTGIRQRFEAGISWRETALFEAYCDQLERFGNAWGHTDLAGFDRRCRAIDRLYESIRTEGYRYQHELKGDGRPSVATRMDEINVDIARDGTLCWRAYGQHRLAIAKLLGLESVPVMIHRRHRGWQARRDRLRRRLRTPALAQTDEMVDHPDLTDLNGSRNSPS